MKELILVIDVLSAAALVGLILLQHGKGADIGAAFGSGASQTLFGSRGTANFLSRTTAVLAAVFFAANLGLAWLDAREVRVASIATQSLPVQVPPAMPPAAPAPPAPAAPVPGAPPEVPR